MLRTYADQVSLWEAVLPEEIRRLSVELARVDRLLDDEVFFAPFVPFFDRRFGRPSTPMETYLRLMFLKFRHGLGYESLCREVTDSITWRRFCRIPLDGSVPHPTTLMKLTTRCGTVAIDGLNEALLAKAVEAKVLRTNRLRADTTVVPANVTYPTDSGLLAKAIKRIAVTGQRIQAAGGAVRTQVRDRSRAAGKRAHGIAAKLRMRSAQGRDEAQAVVQRITGELANLAEKAAIDAEKVLVNARRALRRAQAKAQKLAAAGGADPVVGRRRTAAPGGERPGRVARCDQGDRGADPAAGGRDHPARGDPAGQPARSGCPADWQSPGHGQRRRCHRGPQHGTGEPGRRTATGQGRQAGHRPDRPETPNGHRRPRLRRAERRGRPRRTRCPACRHSPKRQTRQGPSSRGTTAGVPPDGEVAHRV